MKNEKIIIAGAGASGLMAGIAAARQGCSCLFLEHKEEAGKKILATGNGRCNFTNENQDMRNYNSDSPEFVKKVLNGFSKDCLIGLFKEIGMEIWEREEYYYPYSGQASTVRDLLILENKRLGNRFLFNEHVEEIHIKNGFYVKTEHGRYMCENLIVSVGGKAQGKLGSDGSLLEQLKSIGIEFAPMHPALVPLYWDCPYSKRLAGIRSKGKISLLINNEPVAWDIGELQFTDYGISGIPTFNVSRYYSLNENKRVEAVLDFFPYTDRKELQKQLFKQMEKNRDILLKWEKQDSPGQGNDDIRDGLALVLHGFLNEKLLRILIEMCLEKASIINPDFNNLAESLAGFLKEFRAGIKKTRGFDFAQVCTGGALLSQFNPDTLEALKLKGLYITGELLDVDGRCGGYNLQWAFSTGYLAGKAAGKNATD